MVIRQVAMGVSGSESDGPYWRVDFAIWLVSKCTLITSTKKGEEPEQVVKYL